MKKLNQEPYYIYGKHACHAALSNKRRKILKIICTSDNLALISKQYKDLVDIYTSKDLTKILPKDAVHQGIAVKTLPLMYDNLENVDFQNNTRLAILDQVTDPHNLGSILRNAAAFGIEGIIIPIDNSPKECATIAKTSSGALEIVPIYRVVNLASVMAFLKKNSFWIVGLDGEAQEELSSKHFSSRACIVLGAEGKGLRRLTKENCDFIAKIRIESSTESLNVSAASAIAFYESSRK
jgi:23S rRNA (guanosine2251-2'-O)-methyltransferase